MNPAFACASRETLRNASELAQVRREICLCCDREWDEVPADERHVERYPFTGQLVDWRCERSAARAFDRWSEDSINDVGANERAELDYRAKRECR